MLIKKTYIQNEAEHEVPETVYDNNTHIEAFAQWYYNDIFVIDAVEDCNLLNFIYYLYLYSISGYMQDRRFTNDEYRQEYVKVIECLKRNTIDIETLSVLKDTVSRLAAAEKPLCKDRDPGTERVRKHVWDAIRYEDKAGHISGVLTGCTVEDAVGKYYDFAVKVLSKCTYTLYIKTGYSAIIHGCDEKGEYLLDCSSPVVQYDNEALSALDDKDTIDLIARCRDPFVTGEISIRATPVHRKPDSNALFSNLEKESEE